MGDVPMWSKSLLAGALLWAVVLVPRSHAQTPTPPTGQAGQAPVAVAGPPAVDGPAAQAAFGQSLALRMDRLIADPTHSLMGWLAQTSPVPHASQGALRLKVALHTTGSDAKLVKNVGETLIFGGNLATQPFPISISLQNVPDGDYQYAAELRDGDTLLKTFSIPVKLVAGLDEQQASVERRLAKIQGHDSAKASIRYPFDLARVINVGKRVFGSANGNPEFGLSQAGEPTLYDFSAGLKRSSALLAALEKGKDMVWRAGGETVRHYYMPEADEILPYHVFVPSTWNGRSPLPLMFILHGNSRDQDFYFDRDGRIIPKTAEKHGYMVVAPLGYSPNGGYNYVPYGRTGGGPRGLAGASATPQTFGPRPAIDAPAGRAGRAGAGSTGFGGVNGSVTPSLVRSEWSEQDAMRVFDLIKQEYPIDPKRTFLFGYSAGGQGSHYLGPKFAEHWAAIAIGGSNAMPGTGYPFDRLKNIPMMIFVGSNDTPNIAPSRTMTQALQQNGVVAVLKEYLGATHDSAPSAAIADAFVFFDAHPRK
jgi:poly(3-hydroxybutyrate) depolymerase